MKNKSASPLVLIYLFIVLAFAVCSSPARADATYWSVTAGDWFDDANWTASRPDCATDAFINNGGKAEIGSPNAIARSLTLGEGAPGGGAPQSGTLVIDGTNGGALTLLGGPGSCEAPLTSSVIYVGKEEAPAL